jgi:hypothetical protein
VDVASGVAATGIAGAGAGSSDMEGSFNDAYNLRMAGGSPKLLRSRSNTPRGAPYAEDTAFGFGGGVHGGFGGSSDAGSAAALADAADALRRALAAVDAAAAATMQMPDAVP